MKKISNLDELKAARAEARLKAERARYNLHHEKIEIKEDFEGLKTVGAGLRSAISIFSGKRKSSKIDPTSTEKIGNQHLELLTALMSGLG